MRTTLTLDDDIAAKLQTETRRAGRSFREVVNDTLRRGLADRGSRAAAAPFVVHARDLGDLKPGLSLDDVQGLLEQVEGPLHR